MKLWLIFQRMLWIAWMQFDAVVNHLNFIWTEQLSSLWNAVSYILTNNYLHSFNLLVDTFFPFYECYLRFIEWLYSEFPRKLFSIGFPQKYYHLPEGLPFSRLINPFFLKSWNVTIYTWFRWNFWLFKLIFILYLWIVSTRYWIFFTHLAEIFFFIPSYS